MLPVRFFAIFCVVVFAGLQVSATTASRIQALNKSAQGLMAKNSTLNVYDDSLFDQMWQKSLRQCAPLAKLGQVRCFQEQIDQLNYQAQVQWMLGVDNSIENKVCLRLQLMVFDQKDSKQPQHRRFAVACTTDRKHFEPAFTENENSFIPLTGRLYSQWKDLSSPSGDGATTTSVTKGDSSELYRLANIVIRKKDRFVVPVKSNTKECKNSVPWANHPQLAEKLYRAHNKTKNRADRQFLLLLQKITQVQKRVPSQSKTAQNVRLRLIQEYISDIKNSKNDVNISLDQMATLMAMASSRAEQLDLVSQLAPLTAYSASDKPLIRNMICNKNSSPTSFEATVMAAL